MMIITNIDNTIADSSRSTRVTNPGSRGHFLQRRGGASRVYSHVAQITDEQSLFVVLTPTYPARKGIDFSISPQGFRA